MSTLATPTDDTGPGGAVVPLTAATARPAQPGTTRVVLDRHLNPFERLDPDQRKRLLVQVLCLLVAYDPEEESVAPTLLAG